MKGNLENKAPERFLKGKDSANLPKIRKALVKNSTKRS